MNCIQLFKEKVSVHSNKPALWQINGKQITFKELDTLAANAQAILKRNGLKKGDGVLLFDSLGIRLYAAIIGTLAMGCHIVFVEPWMPLSFINEVVERAQPKLFLTNCLGKLWGIRSKAIRNIPKWPHISSLTKTTGTSSLQIESVEEDTQAIITFTSGTTGKPKGVVRNQGFLVHQHEAISELLDADNHPGSDLCIFANFALSNLASGRSSLLMPSKWSSKNFRKLENLPKKLQPETVTCGPAFLRALIDNCTLPSLNSFHIGGALTDCNLLEEGFKQWPNASWEHIYGSSEAEPVAIADAKEAVKKSREHNYFQTLFVGHPFHKIRYEIENDHLWVSGDHVSPYYIGNEEANKKNKRQDEVGNIWHDMGDRISVNEEGWWFSGRSNQEHFLFILEQKIYHYLQSSKSFIHKNSEGKIFLLGENVDSRKDELLRCFPELDDVIELRIYRDKRHRARIDRKQCIKRGAKWIDG